MQSVCNFILVVSHGIVSPVTFGLVVILILDLLAWLCVFNPNRWKH